MRTFHWLSATALATAAVMLPGVALAQSEPQSGDASTVGAATGEQEADQSGEAIVVTGSRIRRPNDDSPTPITTFDSQQIFSTGRVAVGDALNQLPQFRSSLGSQNSTSGLGVRGVNFLDLRSLGRARTLVLVNGRRHVSADIINNGNAVDINAMPTDLIENIEVVTGGASSRTAAPLPGPAGG